MAGGYLTRWPSCKTTSTPKTWVADWGVLTDIRGRTRFTDKAFASDTVFATAVMTCPRCPMRPATTRWGLAGLCAPFSRPGGGSVPRAARSVRLFTALTFLVNRRLYGRVSTVPPGILLIDASPLMVCSWFLQKGSFPFVGTHLDILPADGLRLSRLQRAPNCPPRGLGPSFFFPARWPGHMSAKEIHLSPARTSMEGVGARRSGTLDHRGGCGSAGGGR